MTPLLQREIGKTLRAAKVLFFCPDIAQIARGWSLVLYEPSVALERQLRKALDWAAYAESNDPVAIAAAIEPHEHRIGWPPLPDIGTSLRSGEPQGPIFEVSGEGRASSPGLDALPSHELVTRSRNAPIAPPDRPKIVSAGPAPSSTTKPDTYRRDQSRRLARLSLLQQDPSGPGRNITAPASPTRPPPDLRAPVSPERDAPFQVDAVNPTPPDKPGPGATNVRQVSTFPEIQELFRAVLAETKSRDPQHLSIVPNRAADPDGEMPVANATPIARPFNRASTVHPEPHPGSAVVRSDIASAASKQAQVIEIKESYTFEGDTIREELLLDRLLDRFEDRLREHTIRRFGFTGGLI